MKLLEWLSTLGQSSHEVSFAQSIYQTMLQYHLGLIISEAEKMAKAKAQIAETGKTKISWDEEVAKKNYIWSLDVLENDFKTPRPTVKMAMNYLEANGFVKCFLISGKRSSCYYIPLADVLKHA